MLVSTECLVEPSRSCLVRANKKKVGSLHSNASLVITNFLTYSQNISPSPSLTLHKQKLLELHISSSPKCWQRRLHYYHHPAAYIFSRYWNEPERVALKLRLAAGQKTPAPSNWHRCRDYSVQREALSANPARAISQLPYNFWLGCFHGSLNIAVSSCTVPKAPLSTVLVSGIENNLQQSLYFS